MKIYEQNSKQKSTIRLSTLIRTQIGQSTVQKYLQYFLIKIYRQDLRYQMNDKIISLEIKLEEKRHEIELQKIEYFKLEEEIRTQKRLDDLYKQKKALLLDNFV